MLGVRTTTRLLAVAMLAALLWPTAAWAVATTSLRSVSFADTTHGYIAGGFYNDGVVSWTNNGGASWHAWTVANRFMDGVVASADGGTAIPAQPANTLYGSSDSGLTWAEESPIHALNVVPADMAYLPSGRRVIVGNLANGEAVIASSVGGGPWAPDLRGPIHLNADGDPVPTYAELEGVDAVSGGNVAWAVGQDRTGSMQAPPWAPLIYKTTDGSAWTTQTAPAASTVGLSCVAVVDAQAAFIGENAKTILKTTDGGTTWTRVANAQTNTPAKIKAIDALDANNVLIVGDAGRIAWSSNGGTSWSVNTTAAAGNTLLGAQMLDATHWIVVGDNETILRTADGGATWSGSVGAVAPTVAITAPTSEHLLDSTTISIEGTSSDGVGIGVAKVEVRVQNNYDNRYWSGSAWVASETWLPAEMTNPANGWDHWEAAIAGVDTAATHGSVTVSARATDGLGSKPAGPTYVSVSSLPPSVIAPAAKSITIATYGGTATIKGTLKSGSTALVGKTVVIKSTGTYTETKPTGTGGAFSFTPVHPSSKATYTISYAGDATHGATSVVVVVTPHAKVNTPVVPSYVKRMVTFKTYADLYPKHTAGTTALTFTFQRYEKVGGKYVWVSHGGTPAGKAVTMSSIRSRCTVSMKLGAGKWRVQAKHADSGHATTYSARKYFTIH